MAKLSRRLILVAALVAPLLLAACNRAADAPPAASFKAIDITGADYANRLDLPDTDGRMRHLSDFKGKVTVVFFGYTQCPDVCPTTMARTRAGEEGARRRRREGAGVFVTVDPERDTPAVLKAYVANFSPDFIALRGTPEQVKVAAKDFKVFYSQGARRHAGQLHDRPHRGLVRLRHEGPGPALHALRQRRRRPDQRPEDAARRKALRHTQKPRGHDGPRQTASSALRIFFIAATSIWRMRSALTP